MPTVDVLPDEDGWTEITDGVVPRVDLVGKSANGAPKFLLMKADQTGLLDPETVRGLIAKASSPEPVPVVSQAQIMRAIHQASAPKENPMTQTVVKADDAAAAADAVVGDDAPLPDADEVDGTTAVSADGGGAPTDAPGDPDSPSSPAWEAVDAARARQALQLTIALQRLVEQSADRESQEAATGDCDDMDNVWTLQDVSFAIDAIIDMLAPFAVTEQAEADQGTADAGDAMTKAARLIKAGRVLSSANEAKIRGAADALQTVLATLPAPTDDAAPVAKETAMTEPITKTAEQRRTDAAALFTKATTEKDWTIKKAKGDPAMAVFDAAGKLVGTIDPADLSPIAAPVPPDGGDAAAPDPAPAADPATDPAAPAVVQPDATDGPAADAAVPAPTPAPPEPDPTKVTKAATDMTQLFKSTLADALKEALTPLEERLTKMEAQPMPGGPMLNGAIPGGPQVVHRGSQDDTPSDLRKAWMEEADPIKKQQLNTELVLEGIRNAPRLK